MTHRLLTLVAVCLGLVGLGATAAHAGDSPPNKCFVMRDGALPTCEYDGLGWTVDYGDGAGMGPELDSGLPSAFVAFAFLLLLGGLAVTAYRVWLARRMAQESGMNADTATAMTLLSDDGLDATYLAASLRGQVPVRGPEAPATPNAGDRLRELQRLRDEGLLTHEEYEVRRQAVVDSL